MTQYRATACDTGTCSNYYSDYFRQNSTTATSTGYNNWSCFPTQTGTTPSSSSSTLYNSLYTDAPYNIPCYQSREVPDKPSEQELLRRRDERVKAEEIAKKAREDALEAEEKARLLLLEYLDNENKQRLLDKKPLEIPSRLFGDIKYHIPISNGRIKAWKENKVVTELCLAVRESGYLPTDDIILTKLLHVLHDEENMLRTANHFDIKENLLTRLT
jgi:hypothetical protein